MEGLGGGLEGLGGGLEGLGEDDVSRHLTTPVYSPSAQLISLTAL